MKYVAEHKSGEGGHLYFEQGKLTDSLTTFGPIGPPPPDNKLFSPGIGIPSPQNLNRVYLVYVKHRLGDEAVLVAVGAGGAGQHALPVLPHHELRRRHHVAHLNRHVSA